MDETSLKLNGHALRTSKALLEIAKAHGGILTVLVIWNCALTIMVVYLLCR